MEHGHYDLQSRLVQLGVHVYRDTTTVVLNGYRFVFVDCHLDVGAVACHCLVDGVVNGLVHEVVQTLFADVADVHCRALAHGLKSFKNLYVTCRVIVLGVLYFCHFRLSMFGLQKY